MRWIIVLALIIGVAALSNVDMVEAVNDSTVGGMTRPTATADTTWTFDKFTQIETVILLAPDVGVAFSITNTNGQILTVPLTANSGVAIPVKGCKSVYCEAVGQGRVGVYVIRK